MNINFRKPLCAGILFGGFLFPAVTIATSEKEERPDSSLQEQSASGDATEKRSLVDAMAKGTIDVKMLSPEELGTLVFLSSLSEEKLSSLGRSIKALQELKPEERKELNGRLRKIREGGEAERRRAFMVVQERQRRNFLVDYWNSLPPERAEKEKEKFTALDDAGRRAYVMELRRQRPPERGMEVRGSPPVRGPKPGRMDDEKAPGAKHGGPGGRGPLQHSPPPIPMEKEK